MRTHTSASGGLKRSTPEPDAKKPSEEILSQEIREGGAALRGSTLRLLLSGFSAGLDIGFSPFLVAIMRTLVDGQVSKPLAEILTASMYAMGFIFVVLGRSELFTEQTTLAVLPVLNGQASARSLLRLWGTVYVANLAGTAIFAWLMLLVGPASGVISPRAIGELAAGHSDHPWNVILLSAIFAGWLMGLLSWLVAAARDTVSQILLVWLITSAIGFAHLQHVIVGSVQMFAAFYSGQAAAAQVGHFLLWATLGNIVGGSVFVALIKFSHAKWAESG